MTDSRDDMVKSQVIITGEIKMSEVTIMLAGEQIEIEKGLKKLGELYEKLSIKPNEKCLYLNKSKDIDIPLLPDEHIIIHGDEDIFADNINEDIGDNPAVRNPVRFELNGRKIEQGLERVKVSGKDISCRDEDLESPKLFTDVMGKTDDFVQDDITLVVQETDVYFTVPSGDDDAIDLEECAKKGRRPPKVKKYKIKIDKEKHKVKKQKMEGSEILSLAGKTYNDWSLNQKFSGGLRKSIGAEEIVDFAQEGIERFETVMKQAQQG